jgi:acetyl-CoA carboxylase biotin carboxyl carrier protein
MARRSARRAGPGGWKGIGADGRRIEADGQLDEPIGAAASRPGRRQGAGHGRQNSKTRGESAMDLRKLKTLIDLVSESNISELEITEAEGKVRIVKGGGPGPAALPSLPASTGAMPAAVAAPPVAATPASPEGRFIKSPMVGTFYRSATPGGKPFVDVGEEVKQGQPVCIIEAMKIMNEIEAEIGGKVARILVENGQAVEFGQPLFVLE